MTDDEPERERYAMMGNCFIASIRPRRVALVQVEALGAVVVLPLPQVAVPVEQWERFQTFRFARFAVGIFRTEGT